VLCAGDGALQRAGLQRLRVPAVHARRRVGHQSRHGGHRHHLRLRLVRYSGVALSAALFDALRSHEPVLHPSMFPHPDVACANGVNISVCNYLFAPIGCLPENMDYALTLVLILDS